MVVYCCDVVGFGWVGSLNTVVDLGFSIDQQSLMSLFSANLSPCSQHGLIAMLAAAGLIVQDLFTFPFYSNIHTHPHIHTFETRSTQPSDMNVTTLHPKPTSPTITGMNLWLPS